MSRAAHETAIDSFKGILVCLIVLGHNYCFSSAYPLLFSFLYNFHVVAFLLLPFMFLRPGAGSRVAMADRMARILVPQIWFILVAACAYLPVNVFMGDEQFLPWIRRVGYALLVEREGPFREALGTGLLWFLPALAVQTLLLQGYRRFSQAGKVALVAMAVGWHCVLGLLDFPLASQLPWSLSLVAYVFAIGLLINFLVISLSWSNPGSLVLIGVWLGCSVVCFQQHFFHPLAGDFPKPPVAISTPLELLLQDGYLILSFFALLRLAYIVDNKVLALLGRYSLQIFLIHSFIWQALWRGFLGNINTDAPYARLGLVITTFVATMLLTLLAARLIERTALQRLVFPRSISDMRISA